MIDLHEISRTFATRHGSVVAVRPLTLVVDRGSFVTLLGPSGSGKSTVLRMIAGLETPDTGRVTIDGECMFDAGARVNVRPNHRQIGMVFQSYAIWPHLSVAQNVAYPLQVQRGPRSEIRPRVEDMLELVGLPGLGRRRATELSGGQQQRVALARALIARPRLLLLDEPFSNLDVRLREQLGDELRSLQRQLDVTTVYVTHDQQEALSLSDEVVVLRDGRIEQQSVPVDLYARPVSRFVAEFVGGSNVLPVSSVASTDGDRVIVDTPAGRLTIEQPPTGGTDLPMAVTVRPRQVTIAVGEGTDAGMVGDENALAGVIEHAAYRGDTMEYQVRVARSVLRASTANTTRIAVDTPVVVHLSPADCVLVADDGRPS